MKEQLQQARELHDFNLNQPAHIKGPFRIVSLDIGTHGILSGWLEYNGDYGKYYAEIDEDGIKFHRGIFYKDLDHFAGVLGKFDPYAFALAEPIEISVLSHAALDEIKHLFPQYVYESTSK